ncbi:MAG: ATP-binding cassette domain-containing protein [Myxococcota bacterium]
MISVRGLHKHYKVHERGTGVAAALRSVFKRTYKTVRAVDGVSFEVARGERVGFLGPNGAGKTTTLKVLAGLLHPTEGQVTVDGHEPRRREDAFLKKIMLVMGQKQQLLWDLPPAETLELNRAVYDVPKAQFKATVAELTELLELGPLLQKPVRQLSLGERMKCELAAALVHRPRVLFLDEPTIGLDVTMQVTIRQFVKSYNERFDATILLTSHYMDDVAALCPRVVVIDKGHISYDGTLAALVQRVRPEKRLVLRLAAPVARADLEALGQIIVHDDAHVELQVPQGEVAAIVTRALATLPVADLTLENAPLEEVMSELFARTRSAAAAEADAAKVDARDSGKSGA